MPDPHVEALYYKFVNENEGDSFEGVSPWKGTLGPFDVELRDGNLIAHPHDHHADRESARQVLEPYLRDWESAAFLKGRYRIKFHYDRADVMDRAPEPGSVTVYPETVRATAQVGMPTIVRGNPTFPPPDPKFRSSGLTDALIERLKRYRAGGEPLPAMAYWLLTKIEVEFVAQGKNRRVAAAKVLRLDPPVLDRLGELTDRRDPTIGRKAGYQPTPLGAAELHWIEEVVNRLILRVGEWNVAGGPLPPLITMNDFPPT